MCRRRRATSAPGVDNSTAQARPPPDGAGAARPSPPGSRRRRRYGSASRRVDVGRPSAMRRPEEIAHIVAGHELRSRRRPRCLDRPSRPLRASGRGRWAFETALRSEPSGKKAVDARAAVARSELSGSGGRDTFSRPIRRCRGTHEKACLHATKATEREARRESARPVRRRGSEFPSPAPRRGAAARGGKPRGHGRRVPVGPARSAGGHAERGSHVPTRRGVGKRAHRRERRRPRGARNC